MAKRSARTAASLSSDARAGLLASLRISDRCCSSSSFVRHSICFSNERGCVPCHINPFTLQLLLLVQIWNSTKVLENVRCDFSGPASGREAMRGKACGFC